ncbi:hypothetical protein CDS [Bradyrhizobium sp.]|nr:hypothetical protein CDS [Bradyrhizobium sp.]
MTRHQPRPQPAYIGLEFNFELQRANDLPTPDAMILVRTDA